MSRSTQTNRSKNCKTADCPLMCAFGFLPGMRLEELAKFGIDAPVGADGDYVISGAPSPHPYFERYVASIDRRFGLWRVVGVGRDVRMSKSLRGVRRIFTLLEKPLLSKFGEGHVPQTVLPALAVAPADLADSRGLLCRWWLHHRGALMPPWMEGLVLFALPNTDLPDNAYIRLAITFRKSRRLPRRRTSPEFPKVGASDMQE
jgi:hypothetical protein